MRDIIAEVKKQLNALERQARQARSYQGLQQEARALEIQLLTREYRTLREAIAGIEKELEALATQESGQTADQARLNVELERMKFAVTANDAIGRRRDNCPSRAAAGSALTAAEANPSQ